jgi:glycosyltransferase involved in cell wall biosynthesis
MNKQLVGRRVVILVQNLPVPFDRRVWQEAHALRDAGASVSVICPAAKGFPVGQHLIDGIDVRRFVMPDEASGALGYVREYGLSMLRMYRELRSLSKTGAFDVVHFCNPPDLLAIVALTQKISKKSKLIFDQHDLGPELLQAKGIKFARFFGLVVRSWERIAYSVADQVIATNESYKAVAIQRGKKNQDDVTVVRSGPREDWIIDSEKTRVWANNREFQVGYVGVIGKQEGIDYLLDAADTLVHQEGLDVQFCLVGSGTEVPALVDRCAALRLDEHVSFLGRLSDDDLRSVLANSDICVNPDEYNELNDKSTMNKVVEYMALGRPIVQFDVTEGRFSAGNSSAYAKRNDAHSLAEEMKALLQDKERAEYMGALGRERFQTELRWEKQVPKLISAYVKALDA